MSSEYIPAMMHLPVWRSGTPAIDALRQGLVDLHSACEHISTTFQVCTCLLSQKLCRLLFFFWMYFFVSVLFMFSAVGIIVLLNDLFGCENETDIAAV